MQEQIFKNLEKLGIKFSQIEKDLGMPQNYLSRFKKPENKLPQKWIEPLQFYIQKNPPKENAFDSLIALKSQLDDARAENQRLSRINEELDRQLTEARKSAATWDNRMAQTTKAIQEQPAGALTTAPMDFGSKIQAIKQQIKSTTYEGELTELMARIKRENNFGWKITGELDAFAKNHATGNFTY